MAGQHLKVAVAICVSLPVAAASAQQPFQVGETLQYDVRLGVLPAGNATIRVARMDLDRGAQVYVLTMSGESRTRALSASHAMTSWVGSANFMSRRFHRRSTLAGRTTDETFRIVADSQRYRLEGTAQDWRTPPHPLDELALLYYLRTLPLQPGDNRLLRGYFKNGWNPVRIQVTGREPVTLGSGRTITCLALRITAAGAVSEIWLSDDARRIPAQLRLPLSVGRVKLVLAG